MKHDNIYHSVTLNKDKCLGCTTCLRRCPMEAIRVRHDKARILNEKCIDCGVCIRICPYQAKIATTDPITEIFKFKHRIALPAPALYGQFRNVTDIERILDGLIGLGFDDVFEVARGAKIVAAAERKLLETTTIRPLIGSSCPAVVRLIQMRFPDLLGNVVDVLPPMEVAAKIAKREYSQKHNVPIDQIGAFFITPCPAKMTSIKNPIGISHSYVDGAISIRDIYGLLASQLKKTPSHTKRRRADWRDVNWASAGGESQALNRDNILAVDGIHNVIGVLEEIENNKLNDLEFFEGAACEGGCVGGPLVFENTFVAKNTMRKLVDGIKRTQDAEQEEEGIDEEDLSGARLEQPLEESSVMRLDDNIENAIKLLEQIDTLADTFKGLDCGSCGSPTCRALAEDIVLGYANELDCVFKLKERVEQLARQMVDLTHIRDEETTGGTHEN